MDNALEIHHIDVAGGDATAILVRDENEKILSKVLIDAGAAGGGSQSLTAYITAYLEPATPFDYIISSHYHDDHIKGFYQSKISFTHYVDIGGYKVLDDAPVPSANGSGFNRQPTYFGGYIQHIKTNKTVNKAQRLEIPFIRKDASGTMGPLVIKLGGDVNGATLTCYCADGVLADGTNVLATQKASKDRSFDPNDLSLAFILEWGTFRYFTAGDLSGDPTLQSYYNMENKLVTYLQAQGKLPVTAMKVTHHGSERSSYFDTDTNTGFLDALKAATLIVSCNVAKKVPHPTFMDRVYNYASANKATLLFLNDMQYTPSELEYAGMAKIIGNAALNCNAAIQTDPNIISNKAKAIVLRRLSDGKSETLPIGKDDLTYTKQDLSNNTYIVLLRNGKFVRTGGMLSSPNNLQLTASINAILKSSLDDCFSNQAKVIAGWLKMDLDQTKSDGREYLTQNLPDLAEVIPVSSAYDNTWETKLTEKMQTLFSSVFQLTAITGKNFYTVNNTAFNDFSLEERETIYYLMTGNKYQSLVLYYLNNGVFPTGPNDRRYIRYYRDPSNFWNSGGEPYTVDVTEDRTAVIAAEVGGKRKR
jgi:hypothetical protein